MSEHILSWRPVPTSYAATSTPTTTLWKSAIELRGRHVTVLGGKGSRILWRQYKGLSYKKRDDGGRGGGQKSSIVDVIYGRSLKLSIVGFSARSKPASHQKWKKVFFFKFHFLHSRSAVPNFFLLAYPQMRCVRIFITFS